MGDAEPHDPLRSPLGPLHGDVPDAPDWFREAIAWAPERTMLPVRDGMTETLMWGDPGKPGLVLMHGSAAHADIWRPFAPLLAKEHRVIAFSWAGMGGSSWRTLYDYDEMADDIVDVARQAGLFEVVRRPIMIAHSMGGHPAAIAAHRHGALFAGAAIIDTPYRAPTGEGARDKKPEKPHRSYPTVEAALARFRFAPTQPSPNLYLTDMIARGSIRQVDGGWVWRFDPGLRQRMVRGDAWSALAAPRCPLAFVTGELSRVIGSLMPETLKQAPPDTPHIVIPNAYHHLMVDQPIAFISVLRAILAFWA